MGDNHVGFILYWVLNFGSFLWNIHNIVKSWVFGVGKLNSFFACWILAVAYRALSVGH